MTARTLAQKAQWEKRNQFGQLLGLSRWILSKEPVIKSCPLSAETQHKLITNMQALSADLWAAAKELGWKGPT